MKNTQTIPQQTEALNNALRTAGIDSKYFISTKHSTKKRNPFCIAIETKSGFEKPFTPCKSYDEMNAYLLGIIDFNKGKFNNNQTVTVSNNHSTEKQRHFSITEIEKVFENLDPISNSQPDLISKVEFMAALQSEEKEKVISANKYLLISCRERLGICEGGLQILSIYRKCS